LEKQKKVKKGEERCRKPYAIKNSTSEILKNTKHEIPSSISIPPQPTVGVFYSNKLPEKNTFRVNKS
jgi:hypothetical protein